MLERFCSFHDYVRDYGLQRSEGVLLRYLSQAYKALVQTVPETLRTEEVDDVLEALRGMLRSVDSSLLDEWQSLRADGALPSSAAAPMPALVPLVAPRPIADDPRALAARVRGELHRLVAALANKRYEEAVALVRAPSDGSAAWTAATLAEAMAPYWAEHATLDNTPRARAPRQTMIAPAEERGTFSARQRLLDPAGDEDWMLDAFVDARHESPDAPLVELRAIRR